MNTPRKLTKAKLIEVEWPDGASIARPKSGGKSVTVQFNPASLRVTYTNQVQTHNQSNNASVQHVGRGSSKLNLELIFDISMPRGQDIESGNASGPAADDVRELTKEVAYFINPCATQEQQDQEQCVPPGTRFSWGSFFFDGIVESMDETLDLWSEDGRPLRATVTLSLTYQGIVVGYNPNATPAPQSASPAPGRTPLQAARQGDSLQQMAARAGVGGNWKAIAAANGIENPRVLQAGTLVNIQV
jgi:hypothetical protein